MTLKKNIENRWLLPGKKKNFPVLPGVTKGGKGHVVPL